jgi:hypothetical protein
MPWNLGVLSVSVLSPLSCWFLAFSAIIVLTSLRRLFRSKAILRKRTWRAGGEACIASLNWMHVQGHRPRSRSPDITIQHGWNKGSLPNQPNYGRSSLRLNWKWCFEIALKWPDWKTTDHIQLSFAAK